MAGSVNALSSGQKIRKNLPGQGGWRPLGPAWNFCCLWSERVFREPKAAGHLEVVPEATWGAACAPSPRALRERDGVRGSSLLCGDFLGGHCDERLANDSRASSLQVAAPHPVPLPIA